MEQTKEPFLIYQDGQCINKGVLFIHKAHNVLNSLIHAAVVSVEVGALVINHIVESAER